MTHRWYPIIPITKGKYSLLDNRRFFFGVFQVSESKREASVERETRDGEGACLVLLARFVFAGLRLLRNSKMKV